MFTIELDEDEITAGLVRLAAFMDNLSPVMDEIGLYMITSTRQRIEDGVTPEGKRFAPKSPATIQSYLAGGFKKGASAGPLIRTGDMMGMSLHHEAGPDFMELSSSALYAAVMHFGAPNGSLGAYSGTDKNGRAFNGVAPWGDIPARPFMGFSEQDRTNITDLIAEAMRQAWGAPG